MRIERTRAIPLALLFLLLQGGCMTATAPLPGGAPPSAAEPPPGLPAKGYILSALAPNVYFFSTGGGSTLFAVTAEGAVLANPPRDKEALLRQALREVTPLPIKFVIYTHAHPDHLGAVLPHENGATLIAHREVSGFLQQRQINLPPGPRIFFEKNYSLTFGGVNIELIYPGPTQEPGNVILHFPGRGVALFAGAPVPKTAPPEMASPAGLPGQIEALETFEKLDFTHYAGSSHPRPARKEELREILRYHHAARLAAVEALRRAGARPGTAAARDGAAAECYRLLQQNWEKHLHGFATRARNHCAAWTALLRQHRRTPGLQ